MREQTAARLKAYICVPACAAPKRDAWHVISRYAAHIGPPHTEGNSRAYNTAKQAKHKEEETLIYLIRADSELFEAISGLLQ